MVSAILSILGICWLAVGVSFWLPSFRNSRQFKSIDALRRLGNQGGPLADLPGSDHIGEPHIATPPHGDLTPRYSDELRRIGRNDGPVLTLPEQEVVVAHNTGTIVFDEWSQSYINEDGEPVNPYALQPELNSRATAYSRPLASGQRPVSQPLSPKRRAALRRRAVLKWMAISITSTTIPAMLTGWSFFVTLATLSWLSFATWFGLMLYFMNRQEQVFTRAPRLADADIPDNIVSMDRRRQPEAEIAPVEELFTPTGGSGFARARYAVGE